MYICFLRSFELNRPNPKVQQPQSTSAPSPPEPTPPPRAKPVAAVRKQYAHYEDQIGIMEEHEYPVSAVQAPEGDRADDDRESSGIESTTGA